MGESATMVFFRRGLANEIVAENQCLACVCVAEASECDQFLYALYTYVCATIFVIISVFQAGMRLLVPDFFCALAERIALRHLIHSKINATVASLRRRHSSRRITDAARVCTKILAAAREK